MKYMIIHDIYVYIHFCLFSVRDMHSAFVVIDVQAFKYVSYMSTPRRCSGNVEYIHINAEIFLLHLVNAKGNLELT